MSTKRHSFDVEIVCSGKATGKMRNEIKVSLPDSKLHYDLATDEGEWHGGDGTAPPPLAYFAVAITGCLMTQIRAFSKKLAISIEGLTVQAKYLWQGESLGNQPYVSRPVAFEIDLDIVSPAMPEELTALIHAAKKGCFVEQTVSTAFEIRHRLKVNEEFVEI